LETGARGVILAVMILRTIIAALLALLGTAYADDGLPAHVLLLQRIKLHMKEELRRQPDFTCLLTTERYQREAKRFERQDTLVLEVLTSGDKEFYGSPGAREFTAENPGSFTAGGMSGTGVFALHARTLFVDDLAVFDYRGEEDLLGRRTVRYGYRVPVFQSGLTMHTATAHGTVGMKGSFWADPSTLDVLRLSVEATDIPPRLELRSSTQTIDYARARIAGGDVLLPRNAVLEIEDESGAARRNLLEFTYCRAFSAESNISFDAPAPGDATAAPKRRAETPILPPGLTIAIDLATEVDEADPLGKRIEARVAADVMQKRKLLISAGAVVHGRLRRLERHSDFGNYFVVGLEFTEIELPGGPVRFYAILQDIAAKGRIQLILHQGVRPKPGEIWREEEMYLPYVAGVASFFVKGERLELPRNLRTVWKTREAR
jgi:hypothetical protein